MHKSSSVLSLQLFLLGLSYGVKLGSCSDIRSLQLSKSFASLFTRVLTMDSD